MSNIRAYGHSALMSVKRATVYGEAPVGDYLKVPFYTSGLGGSKTFEANDLAGQGRDPQKPVAGPLDVAGNIAVPLDARYIGIWLTGLLGNPVTTAADDVYTHVFKSGAASLPDYAIEIGHPSIASPAYFMNTGVQVNNLALTMERSGAVRTTLGLMGINETKSAASAAGTPTSMALAQFGHPQGALKKAGAALANVRSFNFTYSNNLIQIETVNNGGNLEGVDPGATSLTGSAEILFANQSIIDEVFAGTPVDLDVTYQISASLKLSFTMHELLIDRAPHSVDGPAGITMPLSFRGNKNTAAGCMMTATLINDVAGTVYVPA